MKVLHTILRTEIGNFFVVAIHEGRKVTNLSIHRINEDEVVEGRENYALEDLSELVQKIEALIPLDGDE